MDGSEWPGGLPHVPSYGSRGWQVETVGGSRKTGGQAAPPAPPCPRVLCLLSRLGGEAAAASFGFLLGLALLGGQRFLDPLVGNLDLLRVLFLVFGEVRTLANQKVLIRHGVVVIGVDLERLVERLQTTVDYRRVLGLELI